MTFYDRLKKHLSVKQHVLVQANDGKYCVFSHFTDYDGDWRHSSWEASEISAMNYIGNCTGYSEEVINERAESENWKIIKAFDILTDRFQIGDMVVVSENTKDLCKKTNIIWMRPMNKMVNKICEIKSIIGSDYKVWAPDKSTPWIFPHSALSYPIETEEENTAAQEAIELLEKNGYVISKK